MSPTAFDLTDLITRVSKRDQSFYTEVEGIWVSLSIKDLV